MKCAVRALYFLMTLQLTMALAAAEKPSLEVVREKLASGEPTRIVCFGDSITGAYYHTGGRRAWCDLLGVALEKQYPMSRVEMFNAGISGNTTTAGLARIDKDVLSRKPHLVVVMFGMNDVARLPIAEYAKNLRTIVDKCQGVGAAVVLCTPNSVIENAARPNAKLAEFAEQVRQIAKEASAPLCDCFADYVARRAEDETAWQLLMSDEIHPNMHGQCRFAERMAETIAGRPVDLGVVPPPADALHHTFDVLARGETVHLVAMPPYDQWVPAALREFYPSAEIRVTTWPTESKSVPELSKWAERIRNLKPDLVVPAVPAAANADDEAKYIREYEWILNRSFPFGGNAWDVAPVLPALTAPVEQDQQAQARLARHIVQGKDVRYLERAAGDDRPAQAVLLQWIAEQRQTHRTAWPALPAGNGTVSLPAQPWPQRPGQRDIKVLIHYPGGTLEQVNEQTGIMLTLHNWGGVDCVGTANPQALADRLNVVALCVNYLQSGKHDSIDAPEPYDFGYLQAMDALRAVWWVRSGLTQLERPFAAGRVFSTGGSGGGNVTLMVNKLAPRTFAAIIDMCGMAKLSDDIAFNLPDGSRLNARWSPDPNSPNYLSPDAQQLRFVGDPAHLRVMKQLGSTSRIVIVHGVDDATCPVADAREMAANMQAAGLAVDTHFITRDDVDGKVFTTSGHALGNRTEIVFRVAGDFIAAQSGAAVRQGPSDFDRRDEEVRYPTANGEYVISYAAGYPVGRFVEREK